MTNTVIIEQKVTKTIEVVKVGLRGPMGPKGEDGGPGIQGIQGIQGDQGLGMLSVIEDTAPQLGGELDAGAHTIGFTQQTATGTGATTIDWKLGNKFKFTFGAFNEVFTFTAPTKACNILLVLVQDGVGSRTVTWPATVKWPNGTPAALSTAPSSIDICSFYFDGTNYYGTAGYAFA